VAAGALVLSACGSSSGPAQASGPTKATDLALAKQGLVVLSDFPTGWKASGKITSGSGSSADVPSDKIAACLGVPKAEISAQWPTENSPDFGNASGASTVDDEVQVFPTAARARTDFSTFSNARTPGCVESVLGPVLRQAAEKGGGAGASVGTITATRQSFPAVGDQSGEIELQVPLKASSVHITLYIDLVVITEGRLETTLSLDGTGSPFDQTLAEQLASAAVRHMS
jgi:hypothetical protein